MDEFSENFQTASDPPSPALISENYVEPFSGGAEICNGIFRIDFMIATIREEASEYLADYELCVQRVKLQLKRDLAAQPENNGRSALISDMRHLFILTKKSSF